MRINHKIRKAENYLLDIPTSYNFVIGLQINPQMLAMKFDVIKGENSTNYIPKLRNGINACRNSIGDFKVDKSKPKETRYRAQKWHLTDWGGHEHSGTSYVPYKRYPRIFIEPIGVQFNLVKVKDHKLMLVSNKVFKNTLLSKKDKKMITFTVNLLVESLGAAEIFPLDKVTNMPIQTIKTVNWEIIPRGERIWNYVKHGVGHVSKSEQSMIKQRFKLLEKYSPDEIYQGKYSYTGYLVFYYKKLGLYVFDSIIYGKATYVFEGEWEKVSHLTKKQIIDNRLAKERIIHGPRWKERIHNLLKNA